MPTERMPRSRWFVVAVVLVAISGVGGLVNGVVEWTSGTNAFQHSVHIADLIFGLAGVVGVAGLWTRRPWSINALAIWAASLVYAAGAAPLAFAPEDVNAWEALVPAGIIGVGLVALVRYFARSITRASQGAEAND